MTVTVKDQSQLFIPPSVQRRAGIKMGDCLEFRVSKGVITIAAKAESTDDEYTPEQRRIIDDSLEVARKDREAGRVYGPFTATEAAKFLRKELKARARKTTA